MSSSESEDVSKNTFLSAFFLFEFSHHYKGCDSTSFYCIYISDWD